MRRYSVTSFILALDELVKENKITRSDYKFIFSKISSIVEKINENDCESENINVERAGDMLTFFHANYYFSHDDQGMWAEEWQSESQQHRLGDKPASVSYYTNGKVRLQKWFLHGALHRVNYKPAIVSYYRTGELQTEQWWLNNNPSTNGHGYSYIKYDLGGNVVEDRTLANRYE